MVCGAFGCVACCVEAVFDYSNANNGVVTIQRTMAVADKRSDAAWSTAVTINQARGPLVRESGTWESGLLISPNSLVRIKRANIHNENK